ncbi:probable DEAD-box ATP-dependent RNA helicase 48 [Actinidia eriantha]|uniref:probable DEAD-box ATP-dependent RNA helicase 48 n=1 Tax=Actinidia eriantha TaxID=165200 RepID=UPI00258B2FF4|nr:probable DEAD-box ATP-dependent RNA helicase 48 [Actinidia eriantha]
MPILQMPLSLPTPQHSLSSSRALFLPTPLYLVPKFSHLSLRVTTRRLPPIRMGGGPRTYPGGVSKWQWKRMQAKKSKQLLKAQLARERQIYEMRKRAELKAAVAELERPWEPVERPPSLFSVHADEQVKVLADRFQRPGGFDLWSESDGPQLFTPGDAVPSARFFPKGVVHSIKPYGRIDKGSENFGAFSLPASDSEAENGEERSGYSNSGRFGDGLSSEGLVEARDFSESVVRSGRGSKGKIEKGSDGFGKLSLPGTGNGKERNGYSNSGRFSDGSSIGDLSEARNSSESVDRSRKGSNGKFRKDEKRLRYVVANVNNLNGLASREVGFEGERRMETPGRRTSNHRLSREVGFEGKRMRESTGRPTGSHRLSKGSGSEKVRGSNSEAFDMNLQHDGSYGFQAENWD